MANPFATICVCNGLCKRLSGMAVYTVVIISETRQEQRTPTSPAIIMRYIVFCSLILFPHDDVIRLKHFPRYWPFMRVIHRSSVNSPHKGQWRGALMFSLICVWINGWVNNREAGDLRRYSAHYDVIVMIIKHHCHQTTPCAIHA